MKHLDKKCKNDTAGRNDLMAFIKIIKLYLGNTNNQIYRMKLISEAIFLLKSIKDKLEKTANDSNIYVQNNKLTLNYEFIENNVNQENMLIADLSTALYSKNSNVQAFTFLLEQLNFIIKELISCGQYNAADKLCEILKLTAETIKSLPYLIQSYKLCYKIRGCIDFSINSSLLNCFIVPEVMFEKPSIQEIMKDYYTKLSKETVTNNPEAVRSLAKFGFCIVLNKIKLDKNLPLNFTMPLFYDFSIKPIISTTKKPIIYFKYLIINKLGDATQICPLFTYYYNPKALNKKKFQLQVFNVAEDSMNYSIAGLLENLRYSLNAHSRIYHRFLYSYVLFRLANSLHEFCFKNQQTEPSIQIIHLTNYATLFFGLFRYGFSFDFIDIAQDSLAYFMSTWVTLINMGLDIPYQVPVHSCKYCDSRQKHRVQLSLVGLIAYFMNIGFRFKYCYKKTFVNENEKSNVRKTLQRISIKYASKVTEISYNSILLKLRSHKNVFNIFLDNNTKWISVNDINKNSEIVSLSCFEWIFDINKRLTFIAGYNFIDNNKSFIEINQNPIFSVN